MRVSFCNAIVNEDGWPNVHHRGGPPRFLNRNGQNQLAYSDFLGNTQLVSVGDVSTNDHVSLILLDYSNRQRLNPLRYMHVENARHATLEDLAALKPPNYRGPEERVVRCMSSLTTGIARSTLHGSYRIGVS